MTPVRGRAVLRGAIAGLVALLPLLVALQLVLQSADVDTEAAGWVAFFLVVLLAAYLVAGSVAGYEAPDTPLTNGMLAGMATVVLWIPLRIVLWLVRDDSRGLVSGSKPALAAGQLFGQLVLAAGVGLLGGLIGARMAARGGEPAGRPRTDLDPSEERPDSAGQGAG